MPAAANQRLYAIVSEDFLDNAGSTVFALSDPEQAPQSLEESPAVATAQREMSAMLSWRTAAEAISGTGAAAAAAVMAALARRAGRFHLLELPVERPVDLIVGSRCGFPLLLLLFFFLFFLFSLCRRRLRCCLCRC